MANLTTIADVLKTQYGPVIQDQINQQTILLNRLNKNSESYNGKNFTVPIHVSRNEGVASVAEGSALPTFGSQGFTSAIIPVKLSYGRIQISGPSISASRTNEGAFTKVLEMEMKGLVKDIKANQNRQTFGDGSGVLATCGTTSNSTTVVTTGTAKLRIGQRIDVLVTSDGTTSTGAVGRTVSAIDAGGLNFTISGAAITTDGTFSVYAASSRNAEPMGLAGIVATTDTVTNGLHGVAVASYPVWKSTVTASGGALTELMMQKLMDDISIAGNGETSAIYTSYGVQRAYTELLTSQRQFVNTMKLDGGVEALAFNKKPMFADKDCPTGLMYFLDESMLENEILSDWDWMDEGTGMLEKVAGYDAYEAIYRRYGELACLSRNSHGKLTGITEA